MQVKTHTVTLDLQDIPKVEKLVPELPAAFQDVDVLVNNAGLSLISLDHILCVIFLPVVSIRFCHDLHAADF